MASKAQRAAVRSRADKANAAIGSFCKVKTILPFVGNWIEAPPASEEVSVSSVFDTKPLSADPDLYLATMATETPIQRDMVLDMLHDTPERKPLRVIIDTPRDWVARFIPGEGWEVAQSWDFGSALSWGYVNFGTTDDGEDVIRASGVPLIAHLSEDTPEAEVFDRAEVLQRQNDEADAKAEYVAKHERIAQTFTPIYNEWRHGGWYVSNVIYPSGAVGCVSRNYEDKKWRIVCDPRPDAHEKYTYPSRDAAARDEYRLAKGLLGD
jgi:hypothetical protein